jgi:hypothetical protein
VILKFAPTCAFTLIGRPKSHLIPQPARRYTVSVRSATTKSCSVRSVAIEKTFWLIVNLEEKLVTKKKQSFDDIVKLAYPTPPSGNEISYRVGYRKGPPANPKGSLVEGESVKVKDGMIFDVAATDKS